MHSLTLRAHACMQDPAVFTESYTAPATLITPSCKVAKNTTDGWSKLLYSAGDPVVYASRADFMTAMMDGTQTDIWAPSVSSHKFLFPDGQI